MKRLALLWLTVIVAVYFCFTCFFCPSIPASASGGGGEHVLKRILMRMNLPFGTELN